MTIDRIKALVADDFDAVNALIMKKIESQETLIQTLSHHLIDSGGKRLRPLLVLLVSHACGYQGEAHIALAAMVEFLHTATLLHDDVVDESTLRRGRETANILWGSKASILVGDYLFTQSLQLMLASNSLAICHLMADTLHEMSVGEVKQLSNRNNCTLLTKDYLDIIRSKTALLFAACAGIGPLLGETKPELQKELYNYGLHLGNAFQLIDDVLDYTADKEASGKNTGDDLAYGVLTMPILYALQHGTTAEQGIIKKSIEQGGLEQLPEVLKAIKSTKAIEFTQKIALQEIDLALSALQILPNSIYKEALTQLAQFAISRNY